MSEQNNTQDKNPLKKKNSNAPAILKKEEMEDDMEKQEFKKREKISKGYTGNSETHEDSSQKQSDTKVEDRQNDNGTRDDDDDGAHDTTTLGQSTEKNLQNKKSGLYNRDENDELQKREPDFTHGDNNQNITQKTGSNPQKKETYSNK